MTYRLLTSIFAAGLLSSPAMADAPRFNFTGDECLPITIDLGKTYTVSASKQIATRVRFLEPIQLYLVSAPTLWDVQFADNHLWIRPLSDAAPGAKTGITVVLESGEEFDFTATKDNNPPTQCYYVLDRANRLKGVQSGLDDGSEVGKLKEAYRNATTEAETAAAQARAAAVTRPAPTISASASQAQVRFEAEKIAGGIEKQASDVIRHFQMSIHTGYEWNEAINDRVVVDSVYDDGRFTYVRVNSGGFGAPAVFGVNKDDDAYVVDYNYDDLTGVYRLNGLYDAMRVRLDDKKIDIVRRR